jgi:hypothetical protein
LVLVLGAGNVHEVAADLLRRLGSGKSEMIVH